MAERDISHVWRDERGRWTDTPGIGDDAPEEINPDSAAAEAERRRMGIEQGRMFPGEEDLYPSEEEISEAEGGVWGVTYSDLVKSEKDQYTAEQWLRVLARDYEPAYGEVGEYADMQPWDWEVYFLSYGDRDDRMDELRHLTKLASFEEESGILKIVPTLNTMLDDPRMDWYPMSDMNNMDETLKRAWLKDFPDDWISRMEYDEDSANGFFEGFGDTLEQMVEEGDAGDWDEESLEALYFSSSQYAAAPRWLTNSYGPKVSGMLLEEFEAINPEGEIDLSPTYVRLGYVPDYQYISNAVDKADRAIQEYSYDNGGDPAVLEALAENYIQEEVVSVPVAIRADHWDAVAILEDGRFKTQQETAETGGAFSPGGRMLAEENGLGIPPVAVKPGQGIDEQFAELEQIGFGQYEHGVDTPRPIYGYMLTGYNWKNVDASQQGGGRVSQYGLVEFILKDDVKQRTTFTVGDSLDKFFDPAYEGMVGVPLDAKRTKAGWDYRFHELMDGINKGEFHPSDIEYFEAQIHDGVSVDDIAKIRFGSYSSGDPLHEIARIMDLADEKRIPWEPSPMWSEGKFSLIMSERKTTGIALSLVADMEYDKQIKEHGSASYATIDARVRSMWAEVEGTLDIDDADPDEGVVETLYNMLQQWYITRGIDNPNEKIIKAAKAVDRDISHVWRDEYGRWTDTPGIGDDEPKEPKMQTISEHQPPLFDVSEYDILANWDKLTQGEKDGRAPALRKYADSILVSLRNVGEYNSDGYLLVVDMGKHGDLFAKLKDVVDKLHSTSDQDYHMALSDYADILLPPTLPRGNLDLPANLFMSLLDNDMLAEMNTDEFITYYIATEGKILDGAKDVVMPAFLDTNFGVLAEYLEDYGDVYADEPPYFSIANSNVVEDAMVGKLQREIYDTVHAPDMAEISDLLFKNEHPFSEVAQTLDAPLSNDRTSFAQHWFDERILEYVARDTDLASNELASALLFYGQMGEYYDVPTRPLEGFYRNYTDPRSDGWEDLLGVVTELEDARSNYGERLYDMDSMASAIAAVGVGLGNPDDDYTYALHDIAALVSFEEFDEHGHTNVNQLRMLEWMRHRFNETLDDIVDPQTGEAFRMSPSQLDIQQEVVGTFDQYHYDANGKNKASDWNNESIQKHAVVTALGQEANMAYEDANNFIAQWAYTSNGYDMRSLSIQAEAAELFNAPLSDWQQERYDSVMDDRERAIARDGQPPDEGLFALEVYEPQSLASGKIDYGITDEDLPTVPEFKVALEENAKKYRLPENPTDTDISEANKWVDETTARYAKFGVAEKRDMLDVYRVEAPRIEAKIRATHNLPTDEAVEKMLREITDQKKSLLSSEELKEMMEDKYRQAVERWKTGSLSEKIAYAQASELPPTPEFERRAAFPDVLSEKDIQLKQVGMPTYREMYDGYIDRYMTASGINPSSVVSTASSNAQTYIRANYAEQIRLASALGFDVSGVPEPEPDDKSMVSARNKIRKALEGMHKRTQEWFDEIGATHVKLYRGVTLDEYTWEDVGDAGDVIEIDENTLESWTHSYDQAKRFAMGLVGDDPQGIVISTWVPAERVLSNARTGFGCLGENEFVVIGVEGTSQVRLVSKERK